MNAVADREAEKADKVAEKLVSAARELGERLEKQEFGDPVKWVYNTFDYALAGYAAYVRRYGDGRKRWVMMGMNPGPWGMAQTGVPFGEVAAVRDWLQLEVAIGKPRREHPKRPVEGMGCRRSEVSGRRLWGLFAQLAGSADAFFAEAFVINYCPLSFMLESGANLTPDKLAAAQREPLEAACDWHLRTVLEILEPEWTVGIGGWATRQLGRVNHGTRRRVATLLHPSPASPLANREWPQLPLRQLKEIGMHQPGR